MKKQGKRLLSILLICVSVVILIGCGDKMTPKKMMKEVEAQLAKVTSFSNQVDMDIKMESVVRYTKVTMDMNMENTMKPKAGHAYGTAQVVMGGVNLESALEIYQVMDGKKQITYSGIDGQWVKEESGQTEGGIALDKNLFSEMGDSIDSFQIASKPVEVDGKLCYEMYGNVTGKELMGVLGSQMIHGFGLVELPDDSMIAKLQIPVIFDVYQEEMLPARMLVDMTDVLNELYDQIDERVDVTQFEIKLQFQSYDKVTPIEVPEEIKAIAKGDE